MVISFINTLVNTQNPEYYLDVRISMRNELARLGLLDVLKFIKSNITYIHTYTYTYIYIHRFIYIYRYVTVKFNSIVIHFH